MTAHHEPPTAEKARRHSAPVQTTSVEEQFSIPTGYGDDRIVLMVKDPWWLCAYWEIQSGTERAVRGNLLPNEVAGLRSILRVYDVTGVEFPAKAAQHSFDITLSGLAMNWYIHTNQPGRSYIVEIGLLTIGGRFLLLARSNRVSTPTAGPSDLSDEEWMVTDEMYWKLFGVAGGIGIGSSPLEARRMLEQRLSSPGLLSSSVFSQAKASKNRGFWLWVKTELIVYGATDPKAQVKVQGQTVPLRHDGTFNLRFALPEGTQVIPVEGTSPDGQETRRIVPVVSRQTASPTSATVDQPAAFPQPSTTSQPA